RKSVGKPICVCRRDCAFEAWVRPWTGETVTRGPRSFFCLMVGSPAAHPNLPVSRAYGGTRGIAAGHAAIAAMPRQNCPWRPGLELQATHQLQTNYHHALTAHRSQLQRSFRLPSRTSDSRADFCLSNLTA